MYYSSYMDNNKTFGREVFERFNLPKGTTEKCTCIKDVMRVLSRLPSAPPVLYQEVIKAWDDWREAIDSDFKDDPTPVEVDDIVWRFLNDSD